MLFLQRCFLLITFICLFAPAAWALDLEAIRFGEHPDKTRIVIETSEDAPLAPFILRNPERLIVDLPSFNWKAGTLSPSRSVQNVRYAAYQPGITRLVFELAAPKDLKAVFKLPPLKNGAARLVIDLKDAVAAPVAPPSAPPPAAPTQKFATLKTDLILPKAKPTPTTPAAPAYKPLIVVDAGHGGQDPGATSPQKYREKNIVLALAQELKHQLEATGRYRVKLTRDSDTYIKLHDRIKLSRAWGADMFISVHADSIQKSNVRGASVYTLSNTASDAQTAKLAEKENRADIIAGVDLSHEDKDVADILIDLAMRDTMNQSRFFANLLVDHFKRDRITILENTHRYAGFAVLKAPDVPSVLIEAGFLSNRKEADLLSQKSYRSRLAKAITGGVDAYFQHVGTH